MEWMLWYQDSTVPLAERVQRAARYYQAKYGKPPTRCLVPKGEDMTGAIGLTCAEDPYVLPGHLMLQ